MHEKFFEALFERLSRVGLLNFTKEDGDEVVFGYGVVDIVGEHYDEVVRECHPELYFAALNGQPFTCPKSSVRGRGLRMQLLNDVLENAVDLYQKAREKHLLRQVHRDDILGSMVLAVAARDGSLDTVPCEPAFDESRIYYPSFDIPSIQVE